jgi:MFS family permease
MNLYSTEALGESPEKFAGFQYSLRFGCKVIAGTFLGWLLTRTNPRAGILATSCLYLISQIWAMTVTGPWYLVAFGIFGAGELVGVYAPNYIVSASRADELRKNTAFMTMLMAPAAPAGYLYGSIVDAVKSHGWTAWGMDSATLGFRLSFLVCALFILSGIILAGTLLPKYPRAPR